MEYATEITDDYDADEELVQNENHHLLRQSLSLLPAEQREAVVLRYFADLTIPEIAATTSARQGTIKSRLSRALDRLEKIMGEEQRL
jgi:RNA polymerase sigma-70 factor (ECF subfamily)